MEITFEKWLVREGGQKKIKQEKRSLKGERGRDKGSLSSKDQKVDTRNYAVSHYKDWGSVLQDHILPLTPWLFWRVPAQKVP